MVIKNKQHTKQRKGISLEDCRLSRGLIAKLEKYAEALDMTDSGFTKELLKLAFAAGLHRIVKKP